jgi:nucleoside-diphosphate-sugar epimerase
MKVAVTGASGFLGTSIVGELLTKGHEVLAVSRSAAAWPSGVVAHLVEDYEATPAADVLVHLAEQSSVQAAEQAAENHRIRTVERTRALVESERFGRVIYGSSGAVYGDGSGRAHRPDETPAGTSIYARTKLACERLVTDAGGVALRLGNVIGPRMSPASVLARVLSQIPGEGDLVLRDDSAVRDFVWVEDVAACVAAFTTSRVSGPFNVGSGEACSVRHLAGIALQVAGEPHRRIVSEIHNESPSHLALDISDTERAIAWRPRVKLDAAIRKILESRHV